MGNNYKQTFDALNIPKEKNDQIKNTLSSYISNKNMEGNYMNTKAISLKKTKLILIAAVVTISLILVAGAGLAFSSQIIEMLSGGRIESFTEGSDNVTSITVTESYPYEVREGRVYFMLDGSGKDITDYCSDETFFQYERVGETGHRHVLHIGGTPNNLGWAEYVFDENGNFTGSSGIIPDNSQWENIGRAELGLGPWGGIEE